MKKLTKVFAALLAVVVIATSVNMPAEAKTKKVTAKTQYSSNLKLNWGDYPTIKTGTTKVTVKKGYYAGAVRFVAPKTGKYKIEVSNFTPARGSFYGSMRIYKPITHRATLYTRAYSEMGNPQKLSTQGGKKNAFYVCDPGFKGDARAKKLGCRTSRYAKISLKKGELILLNFSTINIVDVKYTVKIKK